MYHPTPYYCSIDEGQTHMFYDNYQPPGGGFGWSSLCDEVRIPIEGEHFELAVEVAAADISYQRCQDGLSQRNVDFDDTSIAGLNGCVARFDRNDEGVIVRVERIFHGKRHHSLPFEPETFNGNLAEQVDNICTECWETYVDHQWMRDDEAPEIQVNVWGDDNSRSVYYAAQANVVGDGIEGRLQLVSENGLKKEIHHEDIESIHLTQARDVVY